MFIDVAGRLKRIVMILMSTVMPPLRALLVKASTLREVGRYATDLVLVDVTVLIVFV